MVQGVRVIAKKNLLRVLFTYTYTHEFMYTYTYRVSIRRPATTTIAMLGPGIGCYQLVLARDMPNS